MVVAKYLRVSQVQTPIFHPEILYLGLDLTDPQSSYNFFKKRYFATVIYCKDLICLCYSCFQILLVVHTETPFSQYWLCS